MVKMEILDRSSLISGSVRQKYIHCKFSLCPT